MQSRYNYNFNSFPFDDPFPHMVILDAVDAGKLEKIRNFITEEFDWDRREEDFYRHWSHEIIAPDDPNFPPFDNELLMHLRSLVATTYQTELDVGVQVVAHRMNEGDGVSVHNDAPGLGFECYRIVMYLDRVKNKDCGGILRLHSMSGDKEVIREITPTPGLAFAFPMTKKSFHSVTDIKHGIRHTTIFNFWHIGNTYTVESYISTLVNQLERQKDEDLKLEIDMLSAVLGVSGLTERTITNSNLTARTLLLWDMPRDICIAGLLSSIPELKRGVCTSMAGTRVSEITSMVDKVRNDAISADISSVHQVASILLAHWVQELRTESFRPVRWREVRNHISMVPQPDTSRVLEALEIMFCPSESVRK